MFFHSISQIYNLLGALPDDFIACKLQKKLFRARITELDGSFLILTCTLNIDNLANAETLVFDGTAHMQATGIPRHSCIGRQARLSHRSSLSHRLETSTRSSLKSAFETLGEWIYWGFLPSWRHSPRHRVSPELRGNRPWIL